LDHLLKKKKSRQGASAWPVGVARKGRTGSKHSPVNFGGLQNQWGMSKNLKMAGSPVALAVGRNGTRSRKTAKGEA